jgi:hypothetical protein
MIAFLVDEVVERETGMLAVVEELDCHLDSASSRSCGEVRNVRHGADAIIAKRMSFDRGQISSSAHSA